MAKAGKKTVAPEKPTPLGDRVYSRHVKMLAAIGKSIGTARRAEVLRRVIEEGYERHVSAA